MKGNIWNLQISTELKMHMGKTQSIWKVESHLERLPKGQKALEWLKGLKLGWVVEVRDDQGGWVLRKP